MSQLAGTFLTFSLFLNMRMLANARLVYITAGRAERKKKHFQKINIFPWKCSRINRMVLKVILLLGMACTMYADGIDGNETKQNLADTNSEITILYSFDFMNGIRLFVHCVSICYGIARGFKSFVTE